MLDINVVNVVVFLVVLAITLAVLDWTKDRRDR